MDAPPADDLCSVCQSNFDVPCQANCSHWFFGNCILLVWSHGSTLQPCRCPLCRRQITLLVPTEASMRHHDVPEVAEILGNVAMYNRSFRGHFRGLIQTMRDLPFLLQRLLQELWDPQRSLPRVLRARVCITMILSAAYVLSPVDFFPEAIFGVVGLLDDFLVVLIVLLYSATIYRSVLYQRHGGY
ncbi:hypothetical protein M0R45_005447 [Rubus argutus]|uniref:E3 ubiquitin-protein ligase RNF170 n=1 Tax=Rubus argutus TaxID=59490 RepID=A0AAW1YN67_RUBAR